MKFFDGKTPDGTENHENAVKRFEDYMTRSIPFAEDSLGGFIWVDTEGATAYKKGEVATYLFADGLLIFNVLPKDFSELALEHGAVLGEYEPGSFTRTDPARSPQWIYEKEYIVSVDWNGYEPASIPGNAFTNCTSLASISFPSSVKKIEDAVETGYLTKGAFDGCTSLTSADLSSVTDIGSRAFYGCKALTTVTGLSAAENIGSYAFRECTSLGDIGELSSIKTIGDYAFSPSSTLTVQVPNTVTSVGEYAFGGSPYATSQTPGVTITGSGSFNATLGNGAFKN